MQTTDKAPDAFSRGYMRMRENYDSKVEFSRYAKLCEANGKAIIAITARRTYATVTLEVPSGKELSAELALYALRLLRRHHSPGRVRIDSIMLQRIPVNDAEAVAQELHRLVQPSLSL